MKPTLEALRAVSATYRVTLSKCPLCRLEPALRKVVEEGWHEGIAMPAIARYLTDLGHTTSIHSCRSHFVNGRHAGERRSRLVKGDK